MSTTIPGLTATPAHTQSYASVAALTESILLSPQIVRLCSEQGRQVWTGVTISEAGEILTTSQTLGEAPVVDIELSDGTRGQACVTGRDDDIGLALLKPLLEHRSYDFDELSGTAPTIGDQLALLQHTRSSAALDQRIRRVNGYRSGGGGYDYFQIQAADTTSDGAVLIDHLGQIQGIRMPSLWLLQHQIGNPGEVWAIDAPKVATTALPVLRSGRMHIWPYYPGIGDRVASLPLVFRGEITVDGVPATVGSQLYARVSKAGFPDHWVTETINEVGFFLIAFSPPTNYYLGATVEFWMDCRRSPTTATTERPPGATTHLDLAF